MEQKEKDFFKKLCSFKTTLPSETEHDAATAVVLGHLFFNRMQAIAYATLKNNGLLSKVNREFRNSLKGAYELNLEKNKSFFQCVQYVNEVLSECTCKYAMLKGAYLCRLYPEGYRTSNDIDLLVLPKDVTEVGLNLRKAGFRQGNIRNGRFEPATRKEIIESKMMRGETVPYIKEVDLPGMRFLEVDINFSLDYKPADTQLLEEMIHNTCIKEVNGLQVHTLREDDFFVHLCAHLYKEATTLPWVEMQRDMTLYKYCDIYMLLSGMSEDETDAMLARAKAHDMEKICAFAVKQMSVMFDFQNKYAVRAAEKVLESTPDFVHTVISPKDRKEYVYVEKDIYERLFCNDRKQLLKGVAE